MKRILLIFSSLRTSFLKIHLVDRCLLIFMLIFLIQSAYSMFFFDAASQQNNDIDIIIRTSSSAIFGYFLSANFVQHTVSSNGTVQSSDITTKSIRGFSQSESVKKDEISGLIVSRADTAVQDETKEMLTFTPTNTNVSLEPVSQSTSCSHLQIIVATIIGLFCLIMLLLIRNAEHLGLSLTESSTIAAVQFRDFVSGCVGFLIGCPTRNSIQTK